MTLEIPGQVYSNAICCADVDNDDEYELCIGNSKGNLQVFKGLFPEPWRLLEKLGHVTAIACGDLFNQNENVLVVISADGHCKVFNFKDYVSPVDEDCTDEDGKKVVKRPCLQHCFYQRLPPNIVKAEVGDVNGDDLNELIVTLSDRVVRTYQFRKFASVDEDSNLGGELSALKKWEFGELIGGAGVLRSADELYLLVTQPGGVYHKINLKMQQFQNNALDTINLLEEEMMPEASPELITELKNTDRYDSQFVLAGSDGTVALMKSDSLIWSKKVL